MLVKMSSDQQNNHRVQLENVPLKYNKSDSTETDIYDDINKLIIANENDCHSLISCFQLIVKQIVKLSERIDTIENKSSISFEWINAHLSNFTFYQMRYFFSEFILYINKNREAQNKLPAFSRNEKRNMKPFLNHLDGIWDQIAPELHDEKNYVKYQQLFDEAVNLHNDNNNK